MARRAASRKRDGLTLRAARVRDATALADLRIEFLSELGPLEDPAAMAKANARYFRRALKARSCRAWVAEADGAIVATSVLALYERGPSPRNVSGHEAYLFSMYTKPEWRARGIAHRLLDATLAFARHAGIGRIGLHATAMGRPLYEQYGFTLTGTEMELRLRPDAAGKPG